MSVTLSGQDWISKATAEKDPSTADKYYREAVEHAPNNAAILSNYAVFLKTILKNYDRAQEFYERAIKADPNNAATLGNYAILLKDVRKDYDRAQEFFERAITSDPNNATNLSNYAIFLTSIRKEYDRAQEFYDRVITADPNNATYLGNYAYFLTDIRKDHDRAQEFYERAIAVDRNHATNLGNYAIFLTAIRKDQDRAQDFFERAITADPNNAKKLKNYAIFLRSVRKDPRRAQIFFDHAIVADSNFIVAVIMKVKRLLLPIKLAGLVLLAIYCLTNDIRFNPLWSLAYVGITFALASLYVAVENLIREIHSVKKQGGRTVDQFPSPEERDRKIIPHEVGAKIPAQRQIGSMPGKRTPLTPEERSYIHYYDVLAQDFLKRPWEFLLIAGEDGIFFLPLLYIGISVPAAILASALFAAMHYRNKPLLALVGTFLISTVNVLSVLPHGILAMVLGHFTVDIISLRAATKIKKQEEAKRGKTEASNQTSKAMVES
jgi:Tfp pilus assembly protein PilF